MSNKPLDHFHKPLDPKQASPKTGKRIWPPLLGSNITTARRVIREIKQVKWSICCHDISWHRWNLVAVVLSLTQSSGRLSGKKKVLCFQTLHNACGWTYFCILVSSFMHVHVCCCCFCINDHLLECDFSDSGGSSRKSVAVSLVLSPMKRVQSSPNLSTGTNTVKKHNMIIIYQKKNRPGKS